jgi:hypothetical protein
VVDFRAGRAGHENKPAAEVAKLFYDRRNAEFFERSNACRNKAKDRSVTVGLFEKVAAEARFLIHLGQNRNRRAFESLPTSARRFRFGIETASARVTAPRESA